MWSQRETLLRFFSELFNHLHLICLRFEVYLFYGFALIKTLASAFTQLVKPVCPVGVVKTRSSGKHQASSERSVNPPSATFPLCDLNKTAVFRQIVSLAKQPTTRFRLFPFSFCYSLDTMQSLEWNLWRVQWVHFYNENSEDKCRKMKTVGKCWLFDWLMAVLLSGVFVTWPCHVISCLRCTCTDKQ